MKAYEAPVLNEEVVEISDICAESTFGKPGEAVNDGFWGNGSFWGN